MSSIDTMPYDIDVRNALHEETIEGIQTKIVKHSVMNHLCGYVFLPKNHRFYGKHYDFVYRLINDKNSDLQIMYGLTFSGLDRNGCWCIGFDTGQSNNENQRANKTSLENAIKELTALAMWIEMSMSISFCYLSEKHFFLVIFGFFSSFRFFDYIVTQKLKKTVLYYYINTINYRMDDILHVEIFMGLKIEVWKWRSPMCPEMNHLCGYVFLPEDHLFYGKHYDFVDRLTRGKNGIKLIYNLTYSDLDDNGYWRIGFFTGQSSTENQRANKMSLENAINELKALVRWI
jgi:hypothetical protein